MAGFELFILGELMEGPHHGYLLRDILRRMLGPYRQISWAAIYPLIHELERAEYIEPLPVVEPSAEAPTPQGRQRRLFRITGGGRQRFFLLMTTPGTMNAEYHELFAIKLLYLHFLDRAEQRAILAHGLTYLRGEHDHLQHVFTPESTTTHLPSSAREPIFRMMRFRLASVIAEIDWVESALAQLDKLSGV